MTTPCTTDGCGIHFSTVGDTLSASAVPAALPCNAITCVPGFGLFAFEDESDVAAGTVPIGGQGWRVDLNTLIIGDTYEVTSDPFTITPGVGPMPTTVLGNASACLAQNLITVITGREIRYDGPEGSWFTVSTQSDIDGAGYLFDSYNITSDYRFNHFGVPISDARSSGCSSGGMVIAPAGFYSFRYRQLLTCHASGGPGSFVTSPGLTFVNMTVTN